MFTAEVTRLDENSVMHWIFGQLILFYSNNSYRFLLIMCHHSFSVSLYSLSLLYSKCAKTEFCNLRRCFILFLVLTSTSNPTWICWQEDIKPWMKFKHINLYFTFLFLTRNVKFFAVLIILLEIRKISFIYIRIFTWMMYFEKIYWYYRSLMNNLIMTPII